MEFVRNRLLFLFILVLYFLRGSVTSLLLNPDHSGKGYPSKAQVIKAGGNISLKCEDDFFVSIPLTNHKITWKKKLKSSKSRVSIEENDRVFIRNCSQSRKLSDCLNNKLLSVLTIEKISSNEAGIYSCFVKTKWKEEIVDRIKVIVGYAPDEPTLSDDKCLFRPSDSIMTCCWDPGKQTFINTFFQMKYTIQDTPTKTINCTKNSNSDVCCEMDVENRFEQHDVILEAWNRFGNSTSARHQIIPSFHVKPKMPTDVSLKTKIVNDMNDIIIEWEKPNESYIKHYIYKVRYSLLQPKLDWKVEYGNSETQYVLENMKSSTDYVVQVSAKPDDINVLIDGVWSNWSKKVSIKTNLTAPSKSFTFKRPKTTISFTGTNYSSEITWLPYNNQHEKGFFDKISCGKCDGSSKRMSKLHNTTQYIFHTNLQKFCCTGAHCNDAGCSEEDSMDIKIDNAPEIISNVKITMINETILFVAWNPFNIGSCSIRLCSRPRSAIKIQDEMILPDNVCGKRGFTTTEIIPTDCTTGYFSIVGNWSPCFEYSVTMENYNYELISQSYPSNTVSYDVKPVITEHIQVIDLSKPDDFQFRVNWENIPSEYCKHMQPYIKYRPISGSECSGNVGSKSKKEFFKKINCIETSTTISEDVFGDTEYNVEISLVCAKKRIGEIYGIKDNFQVPLLGTKSNIKTAVGRPKPPTDVTVASLTSPETVLSWKTPDHSNGPVSYEIIQDDNIDGLHEFRTEHTNITVNIGCPSSLSKNKTMFKFTVSATNTMEDGTILSSADATLEDIECVTVLTESIESQSNATVIIVICIVMLMFTAAAILVYYRRKKLAKKLRERFLPNVPQPYIIPEVTSATMETTDNGLYVGSGRTVTSGETCLTIDNGIAVNDDQNPDMITLKTTRRNTGPEPLPISPPGFHSHEQNLPGQTSTTQVEYLSTLSTGVQENSFLSRVPSQSYNDMQYVVETGEMSRADRDLAQACRSLSFSFSGQSTPSSGFSKQYLKLLNNSNERVTLPTLGHECVTYTASGNKEDDAYREDLLQQANSDEYLMNIESCRTNRNSYNESSSHTAIESFDRLSCSFGDMRMKNLEDELVCSSEDASYKPLWDSDGIPSNLNLKLDNKQKIEFQTFGQTNLNKDENDIPEVLDSRIRDIECTSYVTDIHDQQRKQCEKREHEKSKDSIFFKRLSCSSGIQEDLNDSEDLNYEMEKFLGECFPPDATTVSSTNTDNKLKIEKIIPENVKFLDDHNSIIDPGCDDEPYIDIETSHLIPC